jgi:GPI mannosyltransferase 3
MTSTVLNRDKMLIGATLAVALILRIAAALTPAIHHSDEIGQYLDQAHKIVFGYGTTPWEYRVGMRNWLVPLVLSAPMALGNLIASDSFLYLILPKIACAIVSLPILWACWTFGRLRSKEHGFVAFWVAAIWFEFVFFAGHVLSEPLALAAILPAAALLARDESGRRSLILAGFLLALGAVLRFHYGPAILLLAIGLCWSDWRIKLPWVILGGSPLLLISGGIDLATGLTPFEWIFNNIYQNVVANRSAEFGKSSPFGYFGGLKDWWGLVGMGVILLLAFDGRKQHRTYAILFWVAIANVGLHSLIAHKEYRFILLSTSIMIFLAAIGSVGLAQKVALKWPKIPIRAAIATTAALWLASSAMLAVMAPAKYQWTAYGGLVRMMAQARHIPEICAIGLDQDYYYSGSYAVLHRPLPLYITSSINSAKMSDPAPVDGRPAYNAVIARRSQGPKLGAAYTPRSCVHFATEAGPVYRQGKREDICLFQRAGGCAGKGLEKYRINQWLKDHSL